MPRARGGPGGSARHQDVQRPAHQFGKRAGFHDAIDQSLVEQVLGHLDVLRERFAVQCLVDPRAEEPEQGTRFGDVDVAQGSPGGHHAARGGVA